jgi:protein CpxP
MEKTRLLTIAVFALLLLNLGTLGFLILAKPPGRMPHGPMREPKYQIIEKLQLDKAQQEKYENLIVWHKTTISGIEDNIRMTKNRLYLQLLKDNVDTKTKDSLIDVLASYQKQIEQTHFTHFQDIKKICKPDQLNNYYDLTEELSRIFSKPPHPAHD